MDSRFREPQHFAARWNTRAGCRKRLSILIYPKASDPRRPDVATPEGHRADRFVSSSAVVPVRLEGAVLQRSGFGFRLARFASDSARLFISRVRLSSVDKLR